MEPSSSCSPHAEHVVDRPDVEAPRGVEPTGTNGREATHIHTPARVCGAGPGRAPRRRTGSTVLTRARSVNSNTHRVHCPVPEPPHAGGKPRFPADNPRFAAAMAQERRPVPFRTRKLRPGTAMVLHPTGCGRVARRRTTRQGPPDEDNNPRGPTHTQTQQPTAVATEEFLS